jgi:hypothetical protein
MPKRKPSDQSSTQSRTESVISRKAASLKKAVKNGADVLVRPFKKAKRALSSRSAYSAPSHSSRSSPAPDVDDDVINIDDISDHADSVADNSDAGSTTPIDVDPHAELGVFGCILLLITVYSLLFQLLEAVQKTWRSPIYTFFSPDVTAAYHDGRLCHFFPCAARKCKTKWGGSSPLPRFRRQVFNCKS